MQKKDFSDGPCPVARTLGVVGDWWSLLIVRDALDGVRRFNDFHRGLGCAKNILSSRLTKLVEHGVLRTVPAADGSPYREYELTEEGKGLRSYAAVRDPGAVAVMWDREVGDEVELDIGGTLDPTRSTPLRVKGTIAGKHERVGFKRSVVLAVDDARIVVTEGPALVMRPSFYRDVGLSPWKADVVVVKNFFPFLLFFAPYNRKTIFVRTRGTTDFEAAFDLTFDGPVHPKDAVEDWRPRDAERRAPVLSQ